jgi:flavin-dependent dehydrogenase
MRVAIIGAGLSGLSCAIELERHKIRPTIFEKRAHIGEALNYSVIWPRVVNRPIMDPLKYLRKEYNLDLKPINHIKKMIMLSPNNSAVERGNLGYILRRGYSCYALERQLLNYLNNSITFYKYIEIEDIKNEFDYIIIATATDIIAKKLDVWTDTFNAQVRIATVLGRFKSTEVTMWIDTKYAKNGLCYLIPNSEKEASLVQVVNGITTYELDYYWKEFLFTEDIQYYISCTTDCEHDCGFVKTRQVGNVLFVGNSAGFTDDLIGCGGLNAIESGMLAVRAIVSGKDYNTLSMPIFKEIEKLHELRKTMNTLDNSEINNLISFLGIPIIKNVIYNNPFFKISSASKSVKLYNNYIKRRRNSVE